MKLFAVLSLVLLSACQTTSMTTVPVYHNFNDNRTVTKVTPKLPESKQVPAPPVNGCDSGLCM